VAAENRIAMEPTLEASLDRIFGSAPSPASQKAGEAQPQGSRPGDAAATTLPADVQSLMAQARQHYERAIQAQREGDWARYGEEIKRLGAVLEQMPRQP
jgi:uncharacterized membrane protein (UPF0182 family)